MEGKGKKRTERRAVRKKINKRNKEEGSNRGEGDEYKNKKITSWGEEAGDADRSEAKWWVNDLNFDPMETCVIKKKKLYILQTSSHNYTVVRNIITVWIFFAGNNFCG